MKNRKGSHQPFAFIHSNQIVRAVALLIVLVLFIFSLSGLLTSIKTEYRPMSHSLNNATRMLDGKMLFGLMALDNQYFASSILEEEKWDPLNEQILELSVNISLDDPRSFLGRELPGFSIYDSEIMVAGEGTDYTNMPFESSPPPDFEEKDQADLQFTEEADEKEEEKKPVAKATTEGKKVVYIYHSHNRESFMPYLKGVTNIDRAYHSKLNITKVGERLQKRLEQNGIGAIVDKTDIEGRLKTGQFHKSYEEARTVVKEAMAEHKDAGYLIDIHRDSKRKDATTIIIDGKEYAKLAFVIGSEHADFQKNFALAERLHKKIQVKYPGLSRGIFKKGGPGNNGVYNQDLSSNAMLIETGGVDNTFEELYRSMDVLADILTDLYWEDSGSLEVGAPVQSKTGKK
ncbi:MAG: stage II sporulation protein P [Bacillus sp. (in: firmicutes)]